MYRIGCSEVWGGTNNADAELANEGVTASLFANAAQGGKGGDIYYVSVCAQGMLTRVVIADVVGHGERVSEVAGWVYDAVARRVNDGAGNALLQDINRVAYDRGLDAMTTAAVVSFYKGDRELYVSSAGHPPALTHQGRPGTWRPVAMASTGQANNFPLGVDPQSAYDQQTLALESGDGVFMYTDGVLEAMNPAREPFGEERLLSTLAMAEGASPNEVKQHVLKALWDHTGGRLDHDDVTLLAFQVN